MLGPDGHGRVHLDLRDLADDGHRLLERERVLVEDVRCAPSPTRRRASGAGAAAYNGDGTATFSATPVQATGLSTVTALYAVGDADVCATKPTSTLWCFGEQPSAASPAPAQLARHTRPHAGRRRLHGTAIAIRRHRRWPVRRQGRVRGLERRPPDVLGDGHRGRAPQQGHSAARRPYRVTAVPSLRVRGWLLSNHPRTRNRGTRRAPKRLRADPPSPVPLEPMRIGIVGATGQVGGVMRSVLVERAFPVDELRLFASARSAGQHPDLRRPPDRGRGRGDRRLRGPRRGALLGRQGPRRASWRPRVAAAGAVVIDNSSAWRMDPDVPLVVSEVNPRRAGPPPQGHRGQPQLHDHGGHAGARSRCTPRPGSRRSWSAPTRRCRAPGWRAWPSWTSRCARSVDRAAALTFDGGAVDFPAPDKFAEAHRLQRAAVRRVAGRRRPRRDRRGAEAPQREPQDPRHPRPGGVGHLRAGAGVHRPLAVDQRPLRAAALAGRGHRAARGRARGRSWPTCPRRSRRPAPTPPSWAASGRRDGPRRPRRSPCSCRTTTSARAPRSTPSRSPSSSPPSADQPCVRRAQVHRHGAGTHVKPAQAGVASMRSAMTVASSSPRSSWRKWPAPSMVTCGCPLAPGTSSWKTRSQPAVAGSPSE